MNGGRDLPTVEMKIVKGELKIGKAMRHELCVMDADIAIHRLLEGETVYVLQSGPLVTAVQRTIGMALQSQK